MSELNPDYLATKRRQHARKAAGVPVARRVPSGPATAHLQRLQSLGMSQQSVSIVSGVPYSTLTGLMWPNTCVARLGTIWSTTEAAILATPFSVTGLPDAATVSAVGTQRRMRALARIGWSITYQAETFGITLSSYRNSLDCRLVTARAWRRMDDLYRRLADIPGPAKKSIRWAELRGWPPPMAWDEDTIDDPDATPQHDAPSLTTPAERDAEMQRLDGEGWSLEHIAAELGVQVDSVRRKLQRREGRAA